MMQSKPDVKILEYVVSINEQTQLFVYIMCSFHRH